MASVAGAPELEAPPACKDPQADPIRTTPIPTHVTERFMILPLSPVAAPAPNIQCRDRESLDTQYR